MKTYFRILILTVIFAILSTSCDLFHTTDTTRGNSYALIYGVANYIGSINDLTYTYNDAEDMEYFFKGHNFTTTIAQYDNEATKSTIKADLSSIREIAGENDLTVFFFAGHGSGPDIGDGQVFLIPYYTTYTIPSSEIFSDSELLEELKTISGKKLLILDICFAGGFVPDNGVDVDGLPGDYGYTGDPSVFFQTWDKYLTEDSNTEYPDIWVIGSAGKNESAREDDENDDTDGNVENGYYTYYLLKSLGYNHDDYSISKTIPADSNADNLITVSEIYNETFNQFEQNYNDQFLTDYAKYYSHTSGGPKDLILLDLSP